MQITRLIAALALSVLVSGAASAGDSPDDIKIPAFFDLPAAADLKATAALTPGSAGYSAREVALAWHGLASLGEDGASREAIRLLDELPEVQGDALLKAYLGSAYLMKARDQSFIPARVRSVRRGLEILNEAAGAAPHDFRVHAIRAGSAMNLPDIFDYRRTVREDLEVALTMIEGGDAPVADGSVTEGRMLAALVKVCLQNGEEACAQNRLRQLETDFSDNAELRVTVARLRTAYDAHTN